jgi:NCS2 family nucleobase:cation symporter-2
MAKRPDGLIYWTDEKPPAPTLFLLGIQHIFLMSSCLVLPVVLMTELGGSLAETSNVVTLTMIACGIGTILQGTRLKGMGSGFLCPNLPGPNFFAASMQAAWLGGIPLMRGMVIAAGLTEIVFARLIHRLKFLFPPEITGLVVFMVAESLIPLGTSKFLGINFSGEPINKMSVIVSGTTLLVMVCINMWGRGRLKLYNVLIGLICGYSLSVILGLITSIQIENIKAAPWFALPSFAGMTNVTFNLSLLPTFIIVSITGALKSFGNLIMCEKVNDDDWKDPDINRVSSGLVADAICVTVSGVLGGMASDTSASNVAFSKASAATSRFVGFMAGGLFIILGFSPKVGAVLSVMPMPVMGAILIFVTCFMILSSLQIIIGSGVDMRKTFVIAIPIIFGLSLDIIPSLYASVSGPLRTLFGSPLTLSTVLAVVLNQVFRPSCDTTEASEE